VFDNDIPRPRRIDEPHVSAMASEITGRLREEVARHA
jgi:NitT/TauT family transport system ATP-binding protein